MLKQEQENRSQMEFFCVEEFVPKEHLLRKIDGAVDFSYIYELVKELYCEDNGRPSCDPVVLLKMVLIQHLYGIPSLRRTVEEINKTERSMERSHFRMMITIIHLKRRLSTNPQQTRKAEFSTKESIRSSLPMKRIQYVIKTAIFWR